MTMFAYEMEEPSSESLSISEYSAVLSDMDDLWNSLEVGAHKFELLDDIGLEDLFNLALEDNNKIMHHDCMWAGVCGDKYHPGNSSPSLTFTSCASILPETPSVPPQAIFNMGSVQSANTNTAGRSLLLPSARTQAPRTPRSPKKVVAQPSPKRPETPQSLDEEEPPQFKHNFDLDKIISHSCITGRTPANITRDDYDYDEGVEEDESDAEGVYQEYVHPSYNPRNSRTYRENTIASDHSYTQICKSSKQQRLELPGVQTPSDSEEEEEIDVESLGGEKYGPGVRTSDALPTNPSALDRHQLQRTVATAMNVRTLQQQRPGRPACTSRPRKRPRDRTPPAQQSRYRKRKKLSTDPRRSADRRGGMANSDSEAENLEKRSLHNDMERQRRISLKKLFDELKVEVPSIRDKERAPKVLILREAAALCMKLQKEEREHEQLISYQSRLLKRVRSLRMDLAARRPNA